MSDSKAKIVKIVSLSFAALMVLLSIVAAVKGYEVVDPSDFRLVISNVIIESGTVSFELYNKGSTDFDYTTLQSYKVTVKDQSFENRFAHSADSPVSVIGILKSSETQHFAVPYENSKQPLSCGQPLSVELYSNKGKKLGAWTGIPRCTIKQPRPVGLVKMSDTSAEYKADSLTINWELVDADKESQKVLLKKQSGLLKPETAWYSEDSCPDVESGKCMTSLSVYFTCDYVNVRLDDNRKGTQVILTKKFDAQSVEVSDESVSAVSAESYSVETQVGIEKTEDVYGEQVRVCLEGCPADNQCFESGTPNMILDLPVYCEGHSWLVQKRAGKQCVVDYECVSQSCVGGVCAGAKQDAAEDAQEDKQTGSAEKQMNIVYRALQWIDNLI